MDTRARDEAYLSYLLRLWREDHNDESVWRSALESAQTGDRFNFATMADLLTFLREQTEVPDAARQQPGE